MDLLTDIVQAAISGDRNAFGAIVHRFQDMAYGRAFAYLGDHGQAEDAAQEAFIDAYLHLDQLREPAAFPGWFGRMVVKHSDRQRRSAKPIIRLDDAPDLVSREPDPLEAVLSRETECLIHEGMALLSREHREVIELFHLDGYTQQEVADFLDVPISTIKKRLYDARGKIKKGLRAMAPTRTPDKRPSQSDDFARRVQFFIAIRTGDLERVKKLIGEDVRLLDAKTEQEVAPESFWTREVTPIHWAAQTGDKALMQCLLDCGADVDSQSDQKDTPLHYAVMMGEQAVVDLLLARGANPNVPAQCDHTPLHRAVMRGDAKLVEALISGGADLEAEDVEGWTAADWAVLKACPEALNVLVERGARKPEGRIRVDSEQPTTEPRIVPSGSGLLGRMIDVSGIPVDGKGAIAEAISRPIETTVRQQDLPVLETGIKAVDLLAPLKRGGSAGIHMCPGVGSLLLKTQIIRNLIIEKGHKVVYLGLSQGSPQLEYREYFDLGSGEAFKKGVTFVLGKQTDGAAERQAVVETGLRIASDLRDAGNDVLIAVEGQLQADGGVYEFLSAYAGSTTSGAITILYTGDPPGGLEGQCFEGLDATITFSPLRANCGIYPAIDPVLSQSALLRTRAFDQGHKDLVADVRRHFFRHYNCNLYATYKKHGSSCIYLDDGGETVRAITRTRRLDLFLTQAYHGTEMWVGRPGSTVPLAHTVDTCRKILNGEYDDIAEEAWNMMGMMEDILERAERMRHQ